MEKLKQGKLDRKMYWIVMAVIWLLMIMLAVNLNAGDPLGDVGRAAVGMIAVVILLAACVMRLRDAGKSMAHLFLLIVPIYMYIIGFYKSEELHGFGESEEISENS